MVILRSIKLTTTVAAFALFFMPWTEIQCSDKSTAKRVVATQTGIQTITGNATPSEEMEDRWDSGQERALGTAGLVAAALLATGLGITCLLVALLNNNMRLDIAGCVLCLLALLALVLQVVQGFPAKDEFIASVSTDMATNEMSMTGSLALEMAANTEVVMLPAFTYTCVLLGITVLLMLGQLLTKLGKSKPGEI